MNQCNLLILGGGAGARLLLKLEKILVSCGYGWMISRDLPAG